MNLIFYYTKELGVREARDKEAFSLAATLPRSLTPYSIYVLRLKPCFNFLEPLCGASCESVNMAWPQVASDLPSAIELDSVRCEGAVYVTVSFFLSLVSECTALHSLGQAMDM